ncbi:ladderlectin-like [Carassius carassius]|uniref:ladderlectin-like n=1 Tax=Carassius carassius TaxID=217509 RepID=UPI002869563A|nr:ladderlectin-like [Carassius carassius]
MAMLRSPLLLFIVFSIGDAGDTCQYGWTNFGSRCNKFIFFQETWITVERNRIALHANLASVHSEQENDFLLGLLPSSTTQCWLGNQDAVEEGQWLWSDGTPYDYSNWCSGEPNNLNVENCGELNWAVRKQSSDHCWNDESCSNSMGYVCAKDL